MSSFKDILNISNEFFSGITADLPTANRLKVVAQTMEEQNQCFEYLQGTRVILHAKVASLIEAFLKDKRVSGTPAEKKLYQRMTRKEFVQRCIEKRPLVFMQSTDLTVLRDGRSYSYAVDKWKAVASGISDIPIEEYLTYDEIAISALIGVSSPTRFINNGSRDNRGMPGLPGSFEPFGIYIGLVGCRFEHVDEMESRFILRKTESTGNHIVPSCWQHIYHNLEPPTTSHSDRFVRVLDDGYSFDKHYYRQRMRITFDTLLHEAESRAHEYNKPAYIHVVGLGLGVWQITEAQDTLYVEEFLEALKSGLWRHISVVDFSWIRKPSFLTPSVVECIETGQRITIHFSKRNPADPLPPPSADSPSHLLVAAYAWDGNAFPGNEYWIGSRSASGDPAAACCSLISELQNPFINMAFSSSQHIFK